MATVSANADGTHKIRKAVKSLKKQKERIEELEDLLKLAKEKYAQLERELDVFQVEANPTHISCLPTEILAMVFKFFLCDNETHIRRLMLVCKRWHNLVIGSPDLWTVIRIEIPEGCWDENKRVEELETLLENARKKCTQLKQELASYRTTSPASSIHSCPTEILCSIFNYCISSDRALVYHLLLVCKHWHALVVNDPQMWNVIHLSVPEFEWNLCSWAESIRPFVLRCLKLSRFALLHITLDFEQFRSPREQIINRLQSGFMDVPIDITPLSLWLEGLDYDDLESDDEMTAECQPDPVLGLIGLIVGNNGEHMERWGSLELSFPVFSVELALDIWERIQFPAPNLSRVHLYELTLLNEFVDEDPFPIAMPNFSQVQHLKISELTNWKYLSFFPSSIQSLSVHTTGSDFRSLDLSRFTHLRSLTLRRGYFMRDGPEIPDLDELPLLRDLSLIGYFAHLDKVKWNMPSLRSLTLSWRYETPVKSLPNLQPSLVRWSPFNHSTCDGALHIAARVMQNFLLHFINAQDLAVAVHEKAVVLKVLRRLFRKRLLPPRWETVSFHNGEEILETISIQSVIKRL